MLTILERMGRAAARELLNRGQQQGIPGNDVNRPPQAVATATSDRNELARRSASPGTQTSTTQMRSAGVTSSSADEWVRLTKARFEYLSRRPGLLAYYCGLKPDLPDRYQAGFKVGAPASRSELTQIDRIRLPRPRYEHWCRVAASIARYGGHDVSNEPRDEKGRWVRVGGAAGKAPPKGANRDAHPNVPDRPAVQNDSELERNRELWAKQAELARLQHGIRNFEKDLRNPRLSPSHRASLRRALEECRQNLAHLIVQTNGITPTGDLAKGRDPVATMSMMRKLHSAMQRAINSGQLGADVKAKLEELCQPQNLAAVAAFMTAYTAAHASPLAPGLAVVDAYMLGSSATELGNNLFQAYLDLESATTQQGLEEASQSLSKILSGPVVDAITKLVVTGASKGAAAISKRLPAPTQRLRQTQVPSRPVKVEPKAPTPSAVSKAPTQSVTSKVISQTPPTIPAPTKPLLRLTYQPTTWTLDQVRKIAGKARWRAGEKYIRELYSAGVQRHFRVPRGNGISGRGGRFVDAPVITMNKGIIGCEVKTYLKWRTVNGTPQPQSVPLTKHIRQQILKDVWLRKNLPHYDPRWIFLDAPPSADLRAFLKRHRIVHVTHN